MYQGLNVLDEVLRFVDSEDMAVLTDNEAVYPDKAMVHGADEVESGTGGVRDEVGYA